MINEVTKQKACKLYLGGKNRAEIARELNVSRGSVWNWTKGLLAPKHEFVNCAVCHKSVRRTGSQQYYCSRRCKDRAYYLRKQERLRSS